MAIRSLWIAEGVTRNEHPSLGPRADDGGGGSKRSCNSNCLESYSHAELSSAPYDALLHVRVLTNHTWGGWAKWGDGISKFRASGYCYRDTLASEKAPETLLNQGCNLKRLFLPGLSLVLWTQ
jgi:hypothetical protein